MNNQSINKYQNLVNWGHGLSIFFAAFGVIAVTIIVWKLLCIKPDKIITENVFKVEYNLQIDANQLKKLKSQDAIEYLKYVEQNNKKIAEDFNQKINDQYERMEKLIELKEEQNIYNNYGAGIIAIILAIGSFFGFKSINQMHKDTIETAEIEAKKVAEIEAKKVAEEIAKEFIVQKLNEFKNIIINQVLSEIREQIDAVRGDLSNLEVSFTNLEDKNIANANEGKYNNGPSQGNPLINEEDLFNDNNLND